MKLEKIVLPVCYVDRYAEQLLFRERPRIRTRMSSRISQSADNVIQHHVFKKKFSKIHISLSSRLIFINIFLFCRY